MSQKYFVSVKRILSSQLTEDQAEMSQSRGGDLNIWLYDIVLAQKTGKHNYQIWKLFNEYYPVV